MTTEHHTPREQLQLLAESLRLAGQVQYVSTYSENNYHSHHPGWYLLNHFRRLPSGLILWVNGRYLGRRWVDAIEGLHQMERGKK